MSGFGFDRLEERLTSWAPRSRRRTALHCLVWSVVLMVINVVLYVTGVINESHLILVTLILSWVAITFTAADLVATADVREEEDPSSGGSADSDGNDSAGDATSEDDGTAVAGDGEARRAPVYATLEAVVSVVTAAPATMYVRFSPGPKQDRAQPSVDHVSGLELPGLSANPLTPPDWWRGRPVEEWVMRQLCAYQHLQDDDDRRCWLVAGAEVGRGPDNEPLLADVVTLGMIANEVFTGCDDRGEAPPWQAVS